MMPSNSIFCILRNTYEKEEEKSTLTKGEESFNYFSKLS
jgi:hypothetical protein